MFPEENSKARERADIGKGHTGRKIKSIHRWFKSIPRIHRISQLKSSSKFSLRPFT